MANMSMLSYKYTFYNKTDASLYVECLSGVNYKRFSFAPNTNSTIYTGDLCMESITISDLDKKYTIVTEDFFLSVCEDKNWDI